MQTNSVLKCAGCKGDVYAHERLYLNTDVFHVGCAKCNICGKILSNTNFAVGGDLFYCKPHFQQAFITLGGKYPGQSSSGQPKMTWKQQIDKMALEHARANPEPLRIEASVQTPKPAKIEPPTLKLPLERPDLPSVGNTHHNKSKSSLTTLSNQENLFTRVQREVISLKAEILKVLDGFLVANASVAAAIRTHIETLRHHIGQINSLELLRNAHDQILSIIQLATKKSTSPAPRKTPAVLAKYEAQRREVLLSQKHT